MKRLGFSSRLSLGFLVFILVLAVFAPWITPYSYEDQNILDRLQGPSLYHWFGTDSLGRDLLSRIIYGARVSMAVGILTTFFSLVLGSLVGFVAGLQGGWVDLLLMRIVDLFFIFPSALLAILMMIFFGKGLFGILVAIGITSWISQARLVRGQVLEARERLYVESARATGASSFRIVFKHILPNLWGPILVSLTFQIPTNIMSESFLSFIGLGLQPPYASWGTLANEGFRAVHSYPYLMIFPGLVLYLTLLAFQHLGDGLE